MLHFPPRNLLARAYKYISIHMYFQMQDPAFVQHQGSPNARQPPLRQKLQHVEVSVAMARGADKQGACTNSGQKSYQPPGYARQTSRRGTTRTTQSMSLQVANKKKGWISTSFFQRRNVIPTTHQTMRLKPAMIYGSPRTWSLRHEGTCSCGKIIMAQGYPFIMNQGYPLCAHHTEPQPASTQHKHFCLVLESHDPEERIHCFKPMLSTGL